ncbi:MAG TPA: hypothetical protein VHX49_01805 [Candidatus Acidoferrales bacterium]|jgi:hypothetical protein|nr:hypothetical protein [Candidatus Acidoferrales bacterium]
MGDFTPARIEGIAGRETDDGPADQQPGKRKLKSEENPKPESTETQDLVIEAVEHDLDEMA